MQKPKTLCKKCQCLISNNNYSKHATGCKGSPSWFVRNANNLQVGIPTNKKHKELNWQLIQSYYDNNHTFMEVCKEFNISPSTLSKFVKAGKLLTRSKLESKQLRGTNKGRPHSKDEKLRISRSMRLAVLEGRQKTPKPYGRFCKIYHHISWLGNKEVLHGGWELKVALFLDNKKIKWTKSKQSFTYIFEGNLHEYFPDFFLEDLNCYVEVKGRQTEKDLAKWNQFPEKLQVLNKNHINNLEKFFLQ